MSKTSLERSAGLLVPLELPELATARPPAASAPALAPALLWQPVGLVQGGLCSRGLLGSKDHRQPLALAPPDVVAPPDEKDHPAAWVPLERTLPESVAEDPLPEAGCPPKRCHRSSSLLAG